MLPSRFTRAVVAVTATLLVVGIPAAQAAQDFRSPDARDAARRPQQRYYSMYSGGDSQAQDLRSPDARDAARAVIAARQPVRTVRVVDTAPTRFSWADAAIGAVVSSSLVLLVMGGFTLLRRRQLHTT